MLTTNDIRYEFSQSPSGIIMHLSAHDGRVCSDFLPERELIGHEHPARCIGKHAERFVAAANADMGREGDPSASVL